MMNKRKREKTKKIVAIICATLVLLAFIASIVGPAAMAITKEDVEDAQQKTEEAKEDLEKAERRKEEILAQYHEAEQLVIDAQLAVSDKKAEIFEIQTEIAIKEEEFRAAEKEYEEYLELFKIRARAMYESTEIDYLEIFFGAEDFGDLLSKIEIVSQIMKYDQGILLKLDESKKRINAAKTELEAANEKLNDELVILEEKEKMLEDVAFEKQKMLEEISKDVEAYRLIVEEAEAAEDAAAKEYEEAMKTQANPELYTGGTFMWPASGRISSEFGPRIHPVYGTLKNHSGMDIAAAKGTPVRAAAGGVVTLAATNGGYGQCIILNHGVVDGVSLASLYGHNSQLLVSKGDRVEKGDLIAYVGSTGVSTGPHLHFEVRENGAAVNPRKYLES